MVWYGCEPLIANDLARFVGFGVKSAISRVRINVARRIADSPQADEGLELLAQQLAKPMPAAAATHLLKGVLEGLQGKRNMPMPATWRKAYSRLEQIDNQQVQDQIIRLAVIFDDRQALSQLRQIAHDDSKSAERRSLAIETLVDQKAVGFDADLLQLLDDLSVRTAALKGLAAYQSPATAKVILQHYDVMTPDDRQNAQLTLASRLSWATELLDAIQSGRIDANELTAYGVRQIQSLGDEKLTERLAQVWGRLRESSKDKAKQIRSIKSWLTPTKLEQADLLEGKQLFTKHCASCHRLFGEGGNIGPDITGAQRRNLDYMLENIIDPSAAVAKDYQMETLLTADGRVVTGLVASETETTITVQTVNEKLVFQATDIEDRNKSDVSIMPEGLLDPLSENQVRDLMGYLRSR